jgi:hypothetical protein
VPGEASEGLTDAVTGQRRKSGVFDAGVGDRHVTPEWVEEEAEQLRSQERIACSPARAEVSFDCSLSLLNDRGWRLTLLFDWWFWCARRLQRRSV